jgi:Protein of unknown function (DUF3253)
MDVRATILDLALQRAPDRSFCPSEAAKALSANWRPLMPMVRTTAAAMPEILATQRGQPVDPITAKGPIRLQLRP